LNEINIKSLSLLKSWVFTEKDTSSVQRKELEKIIKVKYPKLKQDIIWFVEQWDKNQQNTYFDLIASTDSLLNSETIVMDQLNTFNDYLNTQIMFSIFPKISENGEFVSRSRRIENTIKELSKSLTDKIEQTNQETADKLVRIKSIYTWYTIILILMITFFIFYTSKNIFYLINSINKVLEKTSKGELVDIKPIKRTDEIGDVNRNLVALISFLRKLTEFSEEIGQNKFDTEFKPLSDNDVLGNALLRMRDNLVKAQKEAEKRQEENAQRNWASQGIAVFNEVIRDNSKDLDVLTKAVIEQLVNYTNANIGGLFIVNDEDEFDKFLELKAFFAYDRHKFINKKIKFGETLVGQCYIENDTIFITDVPDDYVYITSGLGSDKPRSILIVPLRFNDIIYGVVELASFEVFPEYKIDFVEKISETIASAISTAKINEKTAKLLEESNEKSKRLELQEIEARENIQRIEAQLEEIKKKYEEATNEKDKYLKEKIELENKIEEIKKQTKLEKLEEQKKHQMLLDALNQVVPYFEMNTNGEIIYANELYIKQLNLPKKEIINTKHIKFINREFINTGNYKQIWDKLKKGEKVDTSIQYMIEGKSRYINEKFIPIFDENDKLIKIAVFGI
jgi:GAF domain-containing protein